VTVDILGDTVDNDVGTEIERVLDVRGEESVVNNDEDTVLVGLRNNSSDIDKAQGRVARTLDPDQTGIGGNVLADIDLDLWCEGHLDAVGLCDLSEVSVGTSVDIGDGDDMAAGSETLEDSGGGGGTGGESEGVLGVLESSNSGLEVGTVGIGGSGVLILANGLANGGLSKCGRQRDGLNHGPVAGSCGAPAWTARVPKLWTGDGGRGGVATGSELRGAADIVAED